MSISYCLQLPGLAKLCELLDYLGQKNWNHWSDVVTVFGFGFTLVGVFFAWQSIREANRHSRLSHAVQFATGWNAERTFPAERALRVVEDMDDDLIRDIYAARKDCWVKKELSAQLQVLMKNVLDDNDCPRLRSDGQILLQPIHSAAIRFQWTRSLNHLDMVLSAWYEEIGASEVMYEQFEPFMRFRGKNLYRLVKANFPSHDKQNASESNANDEIDAFKFICFGLVAHEWNEKEAFLYEEWRAEQDCNFDDGKTERLPVLYLKLRAKYGEAVQRKEHVWNLKRGRSVKTSMVRFIRG